MINKSIIIIASAILVSLSFNLYSKDVYHAPKLTLDAKKGQTVVVKDKEWESNYRIEDSSDRQIASMKEKKKKKWTRDPSSKKKEKLEYWEFNRKYD